MPSNCSRVNGAVLSSNIIFLCWYLCYGWSGGTAQYISRRTKIEEDHIYQDDTSLYQLVTVSAKQLAHTQTMHWAQLHNVATTENVTNSLIPVIQGNFCSVHSELDNKELLQYFFKMKIWTQLNKSYALSYYILFWPWIHCLVRWFNDYCLVSYGKSYLINYIRID